MPTVMLTTGPTVRGSLHLLTKGWQDQVCLGGSGGFGVYILGASGVAIIAAGGTDL